MIHRRQMLAGAAAAIATQAAGAPQVVPGAEPGVRMIPVARGRYRVWTRKVGSGPVKVLLLHGGPGFSHDYLEAFTPFALKAGLEIYYYDQLGCGFSDRPQDPSLWTIERYLTELEEVRRGLGLDRFALYGQSWGGMLAIEYALKHPNRLSRLVISNMTASSAEYVRHTAELRAALSVEDQAVLARYEAENNTGNPTYQAVIDKLNREHVCRLDPWPEPLMRTLGKANFDIYNQMQGPNEFVITGNIRNWDRWADLPRIKTPTLVMGARYDEIDPEQVRREGRLIPRAKTWISERGSHLTMWDDQEAYFAALIPFLQGTG
jgi:proline iminopeptidase